MRPIGDELQALDRAGRLSPSLAEMAWRFLHLHCNRLLHASQRAQEFVAYDFFDAGLCGASVGGKWSAVADMMIPRWANLAGRGELRGYCAA